MSFDAKVFIPADVAGRWTTMRSRAQTELGRAVSLLLGERRERFAGERDLRMFQFQAWLLGKTSQVISFQWAGLIFASALISSHALRQRDRRRGLSASACFLHAFASEDLQDIIDRCFSRFTLHDLLRSGSFLPRKKLHDETRQEIAHLNALTEIRVRLHRSGESSSLNRAFELSKLLMPNGPSRTKLKEFHGARSSREPFLYAAREEAPQFLTMDFPQDAKDATIISVDDLLSQVHAKAESSEAFRKLCGVAKAVAEIIESPLSKELSDEWVNIEPHFPPVEPIPDNLIDRRPRRSAEETKAGRRQRVK